VENPGIYPLKFFLSLSATCCEKSRDQPPQILSKLVCWVPEVEIYIEQNPGTNSVIFFKACLLPEVKGYLEENPGTNSLKLYLACLLPVVEGYIEENTKTNSIIFFLACLLPVVEGYVQENPVTYPLIFFLSLSPMCSGKSREQPPQILSKLICYL
jgi:hypothetical protein